MIPSWRVPFDILEHENRKLQGRCCSPCGVKRYQESSDLLALKDSKKWPIISGPVPSFGCERFSRLLALHTWLKYFGISVGITFIDNYDTFWKQKILYRNDGVHPNHLGSWTLSTHFKAVLRQWLIIDPRPAQLIHTIVSLSFRRKAFLKSETMAGLTRS